MSKRKIYEEIETMLCIGDDSIGVEEAKKLLGWVEDNGKFGTDYLFKDFYGTKIRCMNNMKNRPLYMDNVAVLKQEILRKKWKFNLEPIIIGEYASVLNGQHQLIALILAWQEWNRDGNDEWGDSEPTIEKLIGFGVEENDETINTMDTCKPRSLSDVIYRSSHFTKYTAKERKKASRMCGYAINLIWSRLGSIHAFAPKQTHSESMHFLNKHKKILEAVNHIFVEDVDNTIGRFLSPGYSSGMLYLMGSSSSDPLKYINDPSENGLDMSNWEKAEEFFILISSDSRKIKELKSAMSDIIEEGSSSRKERIAIMAKAWNSFIETGRIDKINLSYVIKDGVKMLSEDPSVGGIDLIHNEYL